MTLDLAGPATGAQGWPVIEQATAGLAPPFAVLDAAAFRTNAADLLRRAAGLPIRLASKSIRSREVLHALLARPGFRGVLAFTLPEALWLATDTADRAGLGDILVGYPSVDRESIRRLAGDAQLAARVAVMVDSVELLDLMDAAIPAPERAAPIRVAIDLDMSWRFPFGGERGIPIGVRRSPVRSTDQARALAEAIVARGGYALVGMMAYESQIAGVPDRPMQRRAYSPLVPWMQRRTMGEIRERRAAAVAAVSRVAELEFVNGGGTGSLESTAQDPVVTDIAAGSGLYGPAQFDWYSRFSVQPAAAFAMPVVRRPGPDRVTVLGGGWIASGPRGKDRLPLPVWPAGLRYDPMEDAGEVQTPLLGPGQSGLRVGDRVWFRHTKAGELAEHVNSLVLIDGGAIVGEVTTYRGEGQAFL